MTNNRHIYAALLLFCATLLAVAGPMLLFAKPAPTDKPVVTLYEDAIVNWKGVMYVIDKAVVRDERTVIYLKQFAPKR
jgi:hypothetical protein